jgi:hypothetical protein
MKTFTFILEKENLKTLKKGGKIEALMTFMGEPVWISVELRK